MAPLIGVMTAKEAKTVLVVLDAISNILRAASKYSEEAKRLLCIQFEELGGVDKLEMLQNHDNNEVCDGIFYVTIYNFFLRSYFIV